MKQYSFVYFGLCTFLLGVGSAYDENSLVEDAKKVVTDGVAKLPDNVKDLIPVMDVPSVVEGEELLKKQCDKYGTNESFDNAMAAKEEVHFCVRGLLNYSEIQNEVEQAKPNGNLDIVFRKYCRRSGKLRDCISNFTQAVEPCLSPEHKDMKYTIANITEALSGFICFKEGDRIALFIAEGGPECLKEQFEGIEKCINTSFSHYIPKQVPMEQEDIPVFTMNEKECGDLSKLRKCVTTLLEKCSEPTSANIIDSLFKFVLKSSPCHKFQQEGSAASRLTNIAVFLTVTLPLLLITKHL